MKVINGNNIDLLKQYPDNYFDAVVTDPPQEKKEKDKITNFLKKNGFLYYSKLDCYVLTN